MDIKLRHRPGNTVAQISLAPRDRLTTEAGAMIVMSSGIDISTSTFKKNTGGIINAAKRALGGDSLLLNHFKNNSEKTTELWLGTSIPGDMITLELNQQNLIVKSDAFLASTKHVEMDMDWQGFKAIFSYDNIFWLNVSGTGKLILSSFGGVYPIEVDGEYMVDTGHIMAFDKTLDFSIANAGKNWRDSYLGGESLVCKFSGKGTIWCQSHNPQSFGAALTPNLTARR